MYARVSAQETAIMLIPEFEINITLTGTIQPPADTAVYARPHWTALSLSHWLMA